MNIFILIIALNKGQFPSEILDTQDTGRRQTKEKTQHRKVKRWTTQIPPKTQHRKVKRWTTQIPPKIQHRKVKRWTTRTPPKHPRRTHVLAKGKQSLLHIKHPSLYSYSQVWWKRYQWWRQEKIYVKIYCHLSNEYFVTVNSSWWRP
jgi:hypothetical protein